MAKRNPLLTRTETLLNNLLGLAITQSSSRGKPATEEVASDPNRMTVSEMRGILQTAIAWQQTKAKIMPEEEEESEFEGLMNGGYSRTLGGGRRKRPEGGEPAPNGAAGNAEGMDNSH